MYFKDVIGQSDIKSRLIEMVGENKVPHAILFSGNEGTGSFPLALAFARYVHCTDKKASDACGVCPSCKKFDKLVHPDTHFVFPIVKQGSGKKSVSDDCLQDWRAFLNANPYFSFQSWLNHINAGNSQGMIYAEEGEEIIRKLNFKTFESEYKVMFIWLPEKMHTTCANRLLKILEEPPGKTIFVLVSENPEQLLTTVLSRTQAIRVKGIAENDLSEQLSKLFDLSGNDLQACLHLANGNWLKAVEYVQSSRDNSFFLQQFIRCMRGAYTIANFSPEKKLDKQRSLKDLKLWSEEMAKLGREQSKKYFSNAQRLLRENFIMNLSQSDLNYLHPEELAFSKKFSPFINHKNVVFFMEELSLAERQIEQNVSPKLIFFDLALKSIMLFKK